MLLDKFIEDASQKGRWLILVKKEERQLFQISEIAKTKVDWI